MPPGDRYAGVSTRSTPNLESPIPAAPPPKRHPYDQWSPDARALDLVGDKWTLLIIRDLAAGPAPLRRAPARAPGHLDRAAALAPEPHGRRRPAHPPALPRGAAARRLRADRALARADARARRARPAGATTGRGRAPRPGEDVNVGAIFRLAPGLLEPPPGLERRGRAGRRGRRRGARAPLPGHDRATAASRSPSASATATPTRHRARQRRRWVRALGPEGDLDELAASPATAASPTALLTGFADAAARRSAASRLGARYLPAAVVRRPRRAGRRPAGPALEVLLVGDAAARVALASARPGRRTACSRSWGRCPCPRGRRTAPSGGR